MCVIVIKMHLSKIQVCRYSLKLYAFNFSGCRKLSCFRCSEWRRISAWQLPSFWLRTEMQNSKKSEFKLTEVSASAQSDCTTDQQCRQKKRRVTLCSTHTHLTRLHIRWSCEVCVAEIPWSSGCHRVNRHRGRRQDDESNVAMLLNVCVCVCVFSPSPFAHQVINHNNSLLALLNQVQAG